MFILMKIKNFRAWASKLLNPVQWWGHEPQGKWWDLCGGQFCPTLFPVLWHVPLHVTTFLVVFHMWSYDLLHTDLLFVNVKQISLWKRCLWLERWGTPTDPHSSHAAHLLSVPQALCMRSSMFGNKIAVLEVSLAALLSSQRYPGAGRMLSVLPGVFLILQLCGCSPLSCSLDLFHEKKSWRTLETLSKLMLSERTNFLCHGFYFTQT